MESSLMELLLTAKQKKFVSVSMDRRAEITTDRGRIHSSLEVRIVIIVYRTVRPVQFQFSFI